MKITKSQRTSVVIKINKNIKDIVFVVVHPDVCWLESKLF